MGWSYACKISEVSTEQPRHVKLNDIDIGVYQVDADYYALEDVCPHAYALLTQGFIEEGIVECPLHEAMFDIKTGCFLKGPECRHLHKYEIKQEGNDLFVQLEE